MAVCIFEKMRLFLFKSVPGETQPEARGAPRTALHGIQVTEALCLGFLICEMGAVIVPTGWCGSEG